MQTSMNFGASGTIFGRAKSLRNKQTYAEILLWSRLRNNQLGVRFRRQHPISNFVVDFYCHQCKLVIEVDGSVHQDKTVKMEDQTKEESLMAMELNILRFTNHAVINHIEEVLDQIRIKIFELQNPTF